MVNPNPQNNKESNKTAISTSFFEIETHSQEILHNIESEISGSQNLSINAQRALLEQIHGSMKQTLYTISSELNQNQNIYNEIQEFDYICSRLQQKHHLIPQQTITIALGQYIASQEPSRFRQISTYLKSQQINTSGMLISAIRASRRQRHDNIAIELISAETDIPESYMSEIQNQTINIIKSNPQALNHDISHVFEGNESLLVENLKTEELFSTSLNMFLNLRIIDCIIEKTLEKLNAANEPEYIINEIKIINHFNEDLASIICERICITKSDILEEYISKEFQKNENKFSPTILFKITKYCKNYPNFIFNKLEFLLNENININLSLLNYFLENLFIERNFSSCKFFIENLENIQNKNKTFETFLKNIYIENFHSLALFHNLTQTNKKISINILLKSYEKSQKNIFIYQIKLILDSFNNNNPLTQKDAKDIIDILKEFPSLAIKMKSEIKNIITKGFFIIPNKIQNLSKESAENYSIMIKQIDFKALNLPHKNSFKILETNYFKNCMENLVNFKNKFQLSNDKMLDIINYLKKIQTSIDPNTDFSIYTDEISKIKN